LADRVGSKEGFVSIDRALLRLIVHANPMMLTGGECRAFFKRRLGHAEREL
jgi:hypothetical protein